MRTPETPPHPRRSPTTAARAASFAPHRRRACLPRHRRRRSRDRVSVRPFLEPEGESFRRLNRLARFFPLEYGLHPILLAIALRAPEVIQRPITGRALRMVRRTVHRAKRGPSESEPLRMRFTPREEFLADAVAAPLRQQ